MQRKAQLILNGLEKSGTVTKAAINWLTLATDPFHDGQIEPAGYPDVNTVPTLVQNFTQTVSIDSTGMSGPTWDCHVFFAPISPDIQNGFPRTMTAARFNARDQLITTPPFAGFTAQLNSGYNVLRSAPGTSWLTATSTPGASVAMPYICEGGCYRLIAAAVEVVNTTPDLYKQGAVTYYRSPSHSKIVTPFYGLETGGGIYEWLMTMESYALPPISQAEAQLYPTSRTLAAEEGYYGIATLNKEPEFLSGIGCPMLGVHAPTTNQLQNPIANQVCYIPSYWPTSTRPMTGSGRVLPFDVHGAVFTGLSLQTTLQVTTRYYVERIPAAADPDLLVLTRPPTPYDPVIQEIYSRVLSKLPVGCTVKENPLGEWFNDVLEMVADYAPGIGKVFGPMGAAAGQLLAGGSTKLLKSRQPRKHGLQEVMEDTDSKMKKRRNNNNPKKKRRPANYKGARKTNN